MGKYYGIFTCRKDVEKEFQVELPEDLEILYAHYDYEDYSGAAFVLCKQNGILYDVYGSHCSCYGLEDQWDIKPTSVDFLLSQIEKGYYTCEIGSGRNELKTILESIKNQIN